MAQIAIKRVCFCIIPLSRVSRPLDLLTSGIWHLEISSSSAESRQHQYTKTQHHEVTVFCISATALSWGVNYCFISLSQISVPFSFLLSPFSLSSFCFFSFSSSCLFFLLFLFLFFCKVSRYWKTHRTSVLISLSYSKVMEGGRFRAPQQCKWPQDTMDGIYLTL